MLLLLQPALVADAAATAAGTAAAAAADGHVAEPHRAAAATGHRVGRHLAPPACAGGHDARIF
jgi:hypothetical protein